MNSQKLSAMLRIQEAGREIAAGIFLYQDHFAQHRRHLFIALENLPNAPLELSAP